ncbi:PREDICTED: F-box protein At1g30790-like [Camelina sativa]|uniref:F-box protein At1g30790-like n=1 Tax=Camelina sativa TaxID=90675 RepID=A0ABM1RJU6_CAMSA|nr:PREDICTED: F-box protein At1g30790-like [Camelina sativa]
MVSHPYWPPDFLRHEVLTLGGGGGPSSWTRTKVTSPPYFAVTKSVCINGIVYYGAWSPRNRKDPVIMCFDVRFETISFIKAPLPVVCWEGESILIEYKGKLASVARNPYADFRSFDLWILEDVTTHDWSKQTSELPFSLGPGRCMTSPGTNKAGEIIFAPKTLSAYVEPFYIYYYNVGRKDIRSVRLLGIADDEEFRRRYGITGECYVSISPQHVESIASP